MIDQYIFLFNSRLLVKDGLIPLRAPLKLPRSALPTGADILRHAMFLRDERRVSPKDSTGGHYTDNDLAKDVARDVLDLWTETVCQLSPPSVTMDLYGITKKVRKLLQRAKMTTSHLNGPASKIERVLNDSGGLFDILRCR